MATSVLLAGIFLTEAVAPALKAVILMGDSIISVLDLAQLPRTQPARISGDRILTTSCTLGATSVHRPAVAAATATTGLLPPAISTTAAT